MFLQKHKGMASYPYRVALELKGYREKEDRKRNLDVCYLSSLFASAFLSISGYRPFLNSYTIVLFVLSVVLLAIYLFSMIRLLILEKR